MLFASAGFLFAFLPLFLLCFMVVPARMKRPLLLIASIAFYLLSNLYEPFAVLVLWIAVLYHYFAAMILARKHDKILLGLFVAVDIIALFSLRLLCNQFADSYYFAFPVGASFYLLMGISYLIEHYRDTSLRTDDLFTTALYLTFFPTMLAGPLIRFRTFYDHLEQLSFRMENFARGARFLTVGLVKSMVAAVLVEAYDSILQYSNLQVNLGIGFLSLAMMYLIVFFAFSGYSDMGVGLCVMIGLPVRRDYQNPLLATSPMGYLRGFFISFYDFWNDYVTSLFEALPFATPRVRRGINLTLYMLALTLWFRVDAGAIWIALPLIAAVLLEELTPVGAFFRRGFGRAVGWLTTLTVMLLYWTMQKLGSYATLVEYLRNLSEVSGSYQSLYTYATSIGFDFIIVAAIALVILLPLSHNRETLVKGRTARTKAVSDCMVAVLLIALLMLTLIYFLPQFPQYATTPYAYFII